MIRRRLSILNFLKDPRMKKSVTSDTFATGNADAIREWLVSQVGEKRSSDGSDAFRERAIAAMGTMAPVLVYMRDVMGVAIDIERIRLALELKSIWMLAAQKRFLARDAETGAVSEIPVPNIPEKLLSPLKAYLGELPDFDISTPYHQQISDEPRRLHTLSLYYFDPVSLQS